jgi:hypothetical protein
MPADDEHGAAQRLSESMIRLEAKIDVVLSQHEGKIDDLTRRQGETSSTLREHDSRITANALTTAETRTQAASTQADVQTLRNDVARDVADIKKSTSDQVADIKQVIVDSRPKNIPSWVAVGVALLAIVLSPMLSALISR